MTRVRLVHLTCIEMANNLKDDQSLGVKLKGPKNPVSQGATSIPKSETCPSWISLKESSSKVGNITEYTLELVRPKLAKLSQISCQSW